MSIPWLLLISEDDALRYTLQSHFDHIAPHQFPLIRRSNNSALDFLDTLALEDLPMCIFIDVQYPLVGLSTMKRIRQRDPQFKMPTVVLLATSITRTSVAGTVVNYAQQRYRCLVLHLPVASASLQQVVEKLKKLQYQQTPQ